MKSWEKTKNNLIKLYSSLLYEYGDIPEAIQMSKEGQLFRFKKLCEIGELNNTSVLDIGCGLGDFYHYLSNNYTEISYTGIDIVPDLIEMCKKKYPDTEFICSDIFQKELEREFDYIFISMVFNNIEMEDTNYLKDMLQMAFEKCNLGLAFNFTSHYKNFQSTNSISYEPMDIMKYCIEKLSYKTNMFHHYDRCDVSVFVYK